MVIWSVAYRNKRAADGSDSLCHASAGGVVYTAGGRRTRRLEWNRVASVRIEPARFEGAIAVAKRLCRSEEDRLYRLRIAGRRNALAKIWRRRHPVVIDASFAATEDRLGEIRHRLGEAANAHAPTR